MQFFKNIINLFTLLVLLIALNINMTSKITERSALKLEEERSYEEQLKNQIKWLSQLKWNWTNNRDENNDKFFYDFFDFCFQNFEMSLTAQLRSLNQRILFHKELYSVKNNISKIKVDIKKILASDLPTKKDFTILKAKFQKVKIDLTEVEMKFDSVLNEIQHKKGEDNDMKEATTPPMLHYGTNGGNGGDEDDDGYPWHEEPHHRDMDKRKQDRPKDTSTVIVNGLDNSNSSDFKVDKQMTGKNERRESEVNSLLMIQNNNNDTNDASNYNENNEKIIENIDKKSEYGVNNNKINKYNYGYKNKNSSDNSTNNNINNISNTYNSSINNNNSNHEDNNKDKDTEKGNQTINNIINENNNSLQIINYNNNNNNFNC